MTIRSPNQALQNQKLRRAQTLCNLFELVRQDGFVLRFTDHDRPLTVEGETFLPIGWGYVSAERRESGLRSGNQEARGAVDGDTITIPDLLGNRYRGAKLYQSTVDWRRPWVWHYRATKRLRNVKFDGSSWVATLEGIGARLQRPVGGQRGGTHSTQCGYVLAATFCGADITDDTHLAPSNSGTSSGSNTGLTLNDTGAGWTVNGFTPNYCVLLTGGVGRGQLRAIESNDADTLVIKEPWGIVPDATTTFELGQGIRVATVSGAGMVVTLNGTDFADTYDDDFYRDGEAQWTTGSNVGHVSPIIRYIDSTKELTFLLPAPFAIDVGDRLILKPGCDGLVTTCLSKFDNLDNFGAEPDTPGSGPTLEQPE